MEHTKKPSTIILFAFIAAAAINAVLYAPALPSLTSFLVITKDQAQFTIAIFLLGYAFSQLLFGPIANAFGRKKGAIIGTLIGIFGTLLCILSETFKSYDLIIWGRFISGLGLGSGVTLTYTMINDSYNNIRARKVTGYCILSFAIAPGLANFIGGLLTKYSGWQGCFYFMLLYNTILLYMLFKLPETLPITEKVTLNFKKIAHGYIAVFTNLKVIILGVVYGLKAALLYGVVALLPFIAIHSLRMAPSTFGTVFFLSYLGYMLGTFGANRFVLKLSPIKSVFIGICIALAGGLILMSFALLNMITIFTLFVSVAIIMFGFPFVFINASILGITSHTRDKASASSILNFISIGLAFLTVTVLGSIKDATPLTLATTTILLSLLAILFYTIFYTKYVMKT